LDEEQQIVDWATSCRQISELVPSRRRRVPGDRDLSPAQAEACSAVAQGSLMALIVGPAGAGKTTALVPAVAYRQALNLGVFGVAPTAAAADVLATETGVAADTLDKLLHEHRQPTRPPDPLYDLPSGATVIVDEAGTVATPKLAELVALAQRHGWRIVLVGDPRQFSAVGRGGMFSHLVDRYGRIELDEVHRFTHEWERHASLRLRNGDPAVLADYDRHGRLHGGTADAMEAGILAAWSQARDRGETVALMANSNDTVDRLNHTAQQIRIARRELDPTGPTLQLGGRRLLVGDEVVTRRNDRTLRTHTGKMVKNRDHWTITAIGPDGSITLKGPSGTVQMPATYVAEHVELGYAQTSHATQGRTVDTALVLLDTPTDTTGIYTPMTRGRHTNHAYIVTDEGQTATDALTPAIGRDWIDRPAVERAAGADLDGRHVLPRRIADPALPHPADDHNADGMLIRRAKLLGIDRPNRGLGR
jgi:ATP-dependent exoDNAse (exonuclease V) alpha subunit